MAGVVALCSPGLAQQIGPETSLIPPPAPAPALELKRQQNASLPPMRAPSAQPQAPPQAPSLKLRSQPGYQQVTVTVVDRSGRYVTDLKEDDFRVLEDGESRSLKAFRIDRDAPVSVGIVVDSSESMGSKYPQAQVAIARFVNDLDSDDDVFLTAFSNYIYLLQPFTFDHTKIIDKLGILRPLRQTALYDAIFDGLLRVVRGRHDKKVLLVVTDGIDNRSKHSIEEVVDLARRMEVLIYSIGIGEATQPSGIIAKFLHDDERVDVETLTKLSQESGAKTFIVPSTGHGEELREDCEAIGAELRDQYTLAYLSPNPDHEGFRGLRVDIPKHPELSVRVRKSVSVVAP